MTQENWLDHQMTMDAERYNESDMREEYCDDGEEEIDPVDRYPGWLPSV